MEESFAIAVTPTGMVVGYGDFFDGCCTGILTIRAFAWTKQSGMIDLGSLGGHRTRPYAVSPTGQVVGYADTATEQHAFSWTKQGGLVDLGTLGGIFGWGFAVNARGQVVGSSTLAAAPDPDGILRPLTHAVLWEPAQEGLAK
jgi:probable HAF family extracellular repeat protein